MSQITLASPEETSVEVTYYEDPACSWCWAFEPAATTFLFEFRHVAKIRHVMGGLRDQPPVDVDFTVQQWKKAAALSRMPFDTDLWRNHVLQTTFTACRAVTGATLVSTARAARLLRRLREAFFTEQTPIDNLETIVRLAAEIGLNADVLRENVTSGRAEELFARDRIESNQRGFGYPTTILSTAKKESTVLLQGAVDYEEILEAVRSLDIPHGTRRRFRDVPEDWQELFKIHSRLTLPEIQRVTGMTAERVAARASELDLHWTGVFYQRERVPEPVPKASPASEAVASPPVVVTEIEVERCVPTPAEPLAVGQRLDEAAELLLPGGIDLGEAQESGIED